MLQSESLYSPVKDCKHLMLFRLKQWTSKFFFFPLLPRPGCTSDCNREVPLSATELCGIMSHAAKHSGCLQAKIECLSLLLEVLLLFVFYGDSISLFFFFCFTPSKSKLQKVREIKFNSSVSNLCPIFNIQFQFHFFHVKLYCHLVVLLVGLCLVVCVIC